MHNKRSPAKKLPARTKKTIGERESEEFGELIDRGGQAKQVYPPRRAFFSKFLAARKFERKQKLDEAGGGGANQRATF